MIDDQSNRICYTILMCVFMYVYTYMYLNEYQRILFAFNSDMLIPCKIICMLYYKCLRHANVREVSALYKSIPANHLLF